MLWLMPRVGGASVMAIRVQRKPSTRGQIRPADSVTKTDGAAAGHPSPLPSKEEQEWR